MVICLLSAVKLDWPMSWFVTAYGAGFHNEKRLSELEQKAAKMRLTGDGIIALARPAASPAVRVRAAGVFVALLLPVHLACMFNY